MVKVQVQDGAVLEFPDGVTDAQIEQGVNEYLAESKAANTNAPSIRQPISNADMGVPMWAQSPEDIEAMRSGEPAMKAAADYLMQNAGDIGGSVVGGIKGAQVGGKVGMPIIGGVTGSILGSATGKEVDQAFQPDAQQRTVSENLMRSAGEEVMGRGLAAGGKLAIDAASNIPVVRQGIDYLGQKISPILESVGMKETRPDVESAMLKDERGVDVRQAQENLMGERPLTVFEETGGAALKSKQAQLEKATMLAQKNLASNSEWSKTRDRLNTVVERTISGGNKQAGDKYIEENVKKSFSTAFDSFNPQFDALKKELYPLRDKTALPVRGVMAKVQDASETMRQELGDVVTSRIEAVVRRKLGDKDAVSLADLTALEKDIDTVIEKFNPAASAQGKKAGSYAANIKPIFDQIKEENLAGSRVLELEKQFNDLAKARGDIKNSRVGRVLGLSDGAQTAKAAKPERVAKVVFESPQTWRETKDILAISNPALIKTLEQQFKANLLEDSRNKLLGEVSFAKLDNAIGKYGEDLIKDVAGEGYLQSLKDAALITRAMSSTAGLKAAKLGIQPDQQVGMNIQRTVLHPMAGRIALLSGLQSRMRKPLGMGEISDRQLFKAMQGKQGQALVEKMQNAPLSDPQAYNLYVQFVREVNKADQDGALSINPVSREAFASSINEVMQLIEKTQEPEKQEQ